MLNIIKIKKVVQKLSFFIFIFITHRRLNELFFFYSYSYIRPTFKVYIYKLYIYILFFFIVPAFSQIFPKERSQKNKMRANKLRVRTIPYDF